MSSPAFSEESNGQFTLTTTATLLRQLPEKEIHPTDKLRLAWQLLADAFRHDYLKDARYARLRGLVTRTLHMRFSEPLAFLQFASITSADDGSSTAAIDSTGFRNDVCSRAILAVADWVDAVAELVDDEGQAGHLDLIINQTLGEVRRKGYPCAAKFEPGSAEWQMFLSAWQASEVGVPHEQLLKGHSAPEARRAIKQNANKRLSVLGVRLAPNKPPLLEVAVHRSR